MDRRETSLIYIALITIAALSALPSLYFFNINQDLHKTLSLTLEREKTLQLKNEALQTEIKKGLYIEVSAYEGGGYVASFTLNGLRFVTPPNSDAAFPMEWGLGINRAFVQLAPGNYTALTSVDVKGNYVTLVGYGEASKITFYGESGLVVKGVTNFIVQHTYWVRGVDKP